MKARKIRGLDGVILILILSFIFTAGLFIYGGLDGQPQNLVVETPEGTFLYDLHQDNTVEARGPLGITTIHIHDGQAEILSSPCPNQICVKSGPIKGAHGFNACLPNKIVIRIESRAQEPENDALSY